MQQKRKNYTLYILILSSIFTAIITVLTFFIKIPSHNGYIHIGDTMIYIASCILPTPFALISAALGGMLADGLGGFIIYIIPTGIIKALISVCFSSKNNKILIKRNLIALFPATLITIFGYYIAEVILVAVSSSASLDVFFDNLFSTVPWVSAVYCIPGNITQAVASGIVFILLGIALDKIKIKDKI